MGEYFTLLINWKLHYYFRSPLLGYLFDDVQIAGYDDVLEVAEIIISGIYASYPTSNGV